MSNSRSKLEELKKQLTTLRDDTEWVGLTRELNPSEEGIFNGYAAEKVIELQGCIVSALNKIEFIEKRFLCR